MPAKKLWGVRMNGRRSLNGAVFGASVRGDFDPRSVPLDTPNRMALALEEIIKTAAADVRMEFIEEVQITICGEEEKE